MGLWVHTCITYIEYVETIGTLCTACMHMTHQAAVFYAVSLISVDLFFHPVSCKYLQIPHPL